ncbi:MAG: hypothetical protein ACOH17_05720 [Cellulomonas sp.]
MAAKTTTWIGGTVFAAVIVLAGSWVLAISPQLAAADDARIEQATVESHNVKLQTDLTKLKAQFDNLDKYKSEIAALEVQIPGTAQLADYLREVSSLTTPSGAFIVSVKPGVPVDIVPGADSAAPAPTPTPSASASASASPDSAAGTAEGDTATAVPAPTTGAIDGFVAIPVDVTLLGTVLNVTSALDQLQSSASRLFLVTAISGKGTEAKEASEGRPATAKGDMELTISGYAYVLKNPAATPAPEGDNGTKPTLPAGPGNGSPMTKA